MSGRLDPATGILQDYSIREVMAFDEAQPARREAPRRTLTVDSALDRVAADRARERRHSNGSVLARLMPGFFRLK